MFFLPPPPCFRKKVRSSVIDQHPRDNPPHQPQMTFFEVVYQWVCCEGTQRCGKAGYQAGIEHGTIFFHTTLKKEGVSDDSLGKLMNHQSCYRQKSS